MSYTAISSPNYSTGYGIQIRKFYWTNAQIAALGATTSGDLSIVSLPLKVVVVNAYFVVTGQAAGVATLTGALGRTGATYIDYVVASDLKAAANTVYGDTSGERGTNLTGYDLPSIIGATDVKFHLISSGGNLSAVTGSSGIIYLATMKLA